MMDMNLTRVDYVQVGITSPRCMRLLPSSSKKESKENKSMLNTIAVADHDGVITSFGVKKGEVQQVFKTLPGQKISRMELGGPDGAPKDRIFVAGGTEVKGFTKKGKQFLNFETNLTEPIKTFFVDGANLLLCGDYVYNQYKDCKDVNHYLACDKINDVLCLKSEKTERIFPVLACQDRVLRVLNFSDLLYEVELPGTPVILTHFGRNGENVENEILYGTSDGQIGLVNLNKDLPMHKWELSNEKRNGGISSLDNYDITGDGVLDLIVGRDDGLLEIYSYDEIDEPKLKFSYSCNESITSVQGGVVSSPGYDEIVCSTYGGWIMSLTSELKYKASLPNESQNQDKQSTVQISSLRQEIDQLQKKVVNEREKYQDQSFKKDAISAVPLFTVNDKFILNKDDASYTLSIEVQMPIEYVLLQSDVPLDLVEVEKNSAVVSYSECKREEGNYLLATYRCQANTTRIELKVRSIEGQYGILQAYITPFVQPKTSQVRQYHIKPLSLHQRTHVFDENRPFNELQLRGKFSQAEAHSWISACVPELPDRPPAGDVAVFHFVSSFLNTLLECKYSKGEAIFRSDNISTISILKDVLTKEATNKKIRLEITYDISDESIQHTLQLIHPILDHQLLLAQKVQLIDALKELTIHETDLSFLSPKYKQILDDADKLKEEFTKQPSHLERLYGMITDLFIDKFKFKGQNVKSKVPSLLQVLDNYNLESLIEFFDNPL